MTRDLGWTLVQFVWQGTMLAGVYALVRWWMGARWSARSRYRWACMTLFTMAAAPVATFITRNDAALPVTAWLAGVALFCVRLARNWRATTLLAEGRRGYRPRRMDRPFREVGGTDERTSTGAIAGVEAVDRSGNQWKRFFSIIRRCGGCRARFARSGSSCAMTLPPVHARSFGICAGACGDGDDAPGAIGVGGKRRSTVGAYPAID